MTFEDFWLAAAENDEFMKSLLHMANQHNEKTKKELDEKYIELFEQGDDE